MARVPNERFGAGQSLEEQIWDLPNEGFGGWSNPRTRSSATSETPHRKVGDSPHTRIRGSHVETPEGKVWRWVKGLQRDFWGTYGRRVLGPALSSRAQSS